ncbi:hypothetical protein ECC02_012344 [Trypanosoma cruzi]|uniref:Uncharacterized protein n=1 Tax=Trypanosoma cruzi TaxID=5693 RepID=A0A7J6XKE6_TRYCR|nr:hypothetical protein ECC02_012344 [Trypanosoma cruzi]
MRVTHHNNNWVGAVQQQSKNNNQRINPRRAPFLTPPQSLLLLFPLLSPSQARHAHSSTRPSSTGLGIVGPSHRTQPSCAPAAPQRTPPPPSPAAPCPPRPSQSPPCHRHAQHTQRHNVVPPLFANDERSTQRVLAHVSHALQPHADQPHRHAPHLVVLVVGADTPILSIHGLVLQEAAEGSHVCVEDPNARGAVGSHPRSVPRTSPLPPIAHTQGRCHGREREVRRTTHAQMHTQQQRHPRRTARKIHAHRTHTTAGKKGRSASKNRAQSFTSLCPDKLAWRLTAGCGGLVFHTHSEARRTPSAPLRVHPAGRGRAPSHPRAIAMGSTNNRRRGPSVPLAGKKEKWRHVSSTASRATLNGTRQHKATVSTAQTETSRSEIPKRKKKKGVSHAEPTKLNNCSGRTFISCA